MNRSTKNVLKNSLIIAIIFLGFLEATAGEKKVSLTQVSSTLSSFENSENDYIKDSIVYKEVGKGDYDQFFKDSAILYGTLVQMSTTQDQLKADKVAADSPFGVASAAFLADKLSTLEEDLNRLNDTADGLNPKDDFKGVDKRKLPEATSGMAIATQQIAKASKLLALLLEG